MSNETLIPALMFFTIGVVLLAAIVMLARFLSKRRNRHPMAGQRERSMDEIRRDASEP